jgi:hypothetical protein
VALEPTEVMVAAFNREGCAAAAAQAAGASRYFSCDVGVSLPSRRALTISSRSAWYYQKIEINRV